LPVTDILIGIPPAGLGEIVVSLDIVQALGVAGLANPNISRGNENVFGL
jgi:hypothetical protein